MKTTLLTIIEKCDHEAELASREAHEEGESGDFHMGRASGYREAAAYCRGLLSAED